MKTESTSRRRITPIKKRDPNCYEHKVAKITRWHDRLTTLRKKSQKENPNTKVLVKRKELLPLAHYIDQIKKVMK